MPKDSKKLEQRVRELETMVHQARVAFIRIGTFSPTSLPPTSPGNGLNLTKVVQKQKVLAANALYRLTPDPAEAERLIKRHQLSNVPHKDWEKAPWERVDNDGSTE